MRGLLFARAFVLQRDNYMHVHVCMCGATRGASGPASLPDQHLALALTKLQLRK